MPGATIVVAYRFNLLINSLPNSLLHACNSQVSALHLHLVANGVLHPQLHLYMSLTVILRIRYCYGWLSIDSYINAIMLILWEVTTTETGNY